LTNKKFVVKGVFRSQFVDYRKFKYYVVYFVICSIWFMPAMDIFSVCRNNNASNVALAVDSLPYQ